MPTDDFRFTKPIEVVIQIGKGNKAHEHNTYFGKIDQRIRFFFARRLHEFTWERFKTVFVDAIDVTTRGIEKVKQVVVLKRRRQIGHIDAHWFDHKWAVGNFRQRIGVRYKCGGIDEALT